MEKLKNTTSEITAKEVNTLREEYSTIIMNLLDKYAIRRAPYLSVWNYDASIRTAWDKTFGMVK